MDILNADGLKSLMGFHKEPCVSIYMPTHRKGSEVEQDPIRFKNLLRDAEKEMEKKGLRKNQIDSILKPAYNFIDDVKFWNHQSDGLAFFMCEGEHQYFRLPLSFKPMAYVHKRYYVKPLLPAMSGNEQYLVLALSQKNLRLFQGSKDSLSEVDLHNVPTSFDEAHKFDVPEKSLQFHSGTESTQGGGDRAAIFHGHGVGMDDSKRKKNILRYFQMVDDGLEKVIKNENTPMILAGLEYLIPIYKEANSYPHLVSRSVEQNVDDLSEKELHEKVWGIIGDELKNKMEYASRNYKELKDDGKKSDDLKEIVKAAYNGRVDYLFLSANGDQRWGKFDSDAQAVDLHDSREEEDEDLLDLAAVYTLLNNGTVYSVENDEMKEKIISAVFRY